MNTDKICIPSPCNERWNTMIPKDKGRHCNTCKETVVDFTSMTEEEIKNYFEKHGGTKICGHYKITQVDTPLPIFHKKLLHLHEYLQEQLSVRFFKVGLLSFVTMCLMMTGCRTRTMGRRGAQGFGMAKDKVHTGLQSRPPVDFFKMGLIAICLMFTSCTTTIIGRNGGRSGTTKGKMHTTKEKIHIAFISDKKIING